MSGVIDAARLAPCKQYMSVDIDEHDTLIAAFMGAADEYLDGAGVNPALSPSMYDVIVWNMTLQMYDGRDAGVTPAQAAVTPLVRQMLTQLKLRSAYGEVPDDGAGG